MGLIGGVMGALFGNGRNVIRDTAEVFRINAEASDARDAAYRAAALAEFGAEFAHPRQGRFDGFVDGLNRIPRPALAFGTLGLFVAAMADPIWFASRMQGLALVPEPLWWLMGAIVSFYFGSRYQAKAQDFQRSVTETMARTPIVLGNIASLGAMDVVGSEGAGNAALDDWRAGRDG
ncbi:MAG: holin family protein [Paracoccaceae bacterium]